MCCQTVARRSVAPSSGVFPAATGTKVHLWTRSRILKKKSFRKIIIKLLPLPDLRECVTSMNSQGLLVFLLLGGDGPQLKI